MGAIERYYFGLMPSSGGLVRFYVGAYAFVITFSSVVGLIIKTIQRKL